MTVIDRPIDLTSLEPDPSPALAPTPAPPQRQPGLNASTLSLCAFFLAMFAFPVGVLDTTRRCLAKQSIEDSLLHIAHGSHYIGNRRLSRSSGIFCVVKRNLFTGVDDGFSEHCVRTITTVLKIHVFNVGSRVGSSVNEAYFADHAVHHISTTLLELGCEDG